MTAALALWKYEKPYFKWIENILFVGVDSGDFSFQIHEKELQLQLRNFLLDRYPLIEPTPTPPEDLEFAPENSEPANEDHLEAFIPEENECECCAALGKIGFGTHTAGNGQWLCDDCGEAYALRTPEREADVWYDNEHEK